MARKKASSHQFISRSQLLIAALVTLFVFTIGLAVVVRDHTLQIDQLAEDNFNMLVRNAALEACLRDQTPISECTFPQRFEY